MACVGMCIQLLSLPIGLHLDENIEFFNTLCSLSDLFKWKQSDGS